MSWRSLSIYPLKSPFYPDIVPFQKYSGCVEATFSTTMSANQDTIVTQNVPSLPANSTILFYSILLTNEEIYTPADLRTGAVRLINGNTQYQYTIHTSGNIVGTHRTYVTFNLFYENDEPL